ncbi:MAG: ATP-binding protein [Candidatus Sumerlaeota bacterium]|nr:ATP-binding protein [Candidatus Sumerlaeota bacterium]
MIKSLKLSNVGPKPGLEIDEFGERLNLFTGDNALGKSFLLDIVWWALTRKWPAEINNKLPAGLMARPNAPGKASIKFAFTAKSKLKPISYMSEFDRSAQAWTGKAGRPANPGLVLYAQADGSFAAWDPARNYWKKKGNIDVQDRPPAYVFTPREIWDGLKDDERGLLCNGLVMDWASWQNRNGAPFHRLCSVLTALSPGEEEKIEPGELAKISLDDPREIPTLKMPYGQSVPVLHASAGIRRIIALAYLLVWTWEEHKKASELLGQKTSSQVVLLIDEIEAHLHPKWQFRIIYSLLNVMKSLADEANVQVITATHSPLVLASAEPWFDPKKDAWFDLDLERAGESYDVVLTHRDFEKHGDVSNWLTSEAFDLTSSRAPEFAGLLNEASNLINKSGATSKEIQAMYQRLLKSLSPKDSFLFRWRAICEKKGWLS